MARRTPPVVDLVREMLRGDSAAQIAESWGCTRRAIYYALDRHADTGNVAPVMVPMLFGGDTVAQRRLLGRIKAAHASGVQVIGWNALEAARLRRAGRAVLVDDRAHGWNAATAGR
jgi:hypothetical protein